MIVECDAMLTTILRMRTASGLRLHHIGLILFFLSALPTRATAAAQRLPSEDSIRQTIERRLAEQSIHGVTVSIEAGTVTLTGTVASLWEKNEAREQAWEINDSGAVFDQLKVLQSIGDEQIRDHVTENIRHYVFFTIFDDVSVDVQEGVVTLTGAVTMLFKAFEFAQVVSRVSGVQRIRNNILRLPESDVDTRLRYILGRRLYSDPIFWSYAIQPNPPIHILVNGGRVTLVGTVHSEGERRAAEMIVRETSDVLSCENDLRVDREG
jgi:hyperosmotically inducible periplasmic protein